MLNRNILVISILFASVTLFGQATKKGRQISSWQDTTFIKVALTDTLNDKKIIALNTGQKAVIYVRLRPILIEANEKLSIDFVRPEYEKIIRFINKASFDSGTLFMDDHYNLPLFEHLISHQLINGNAKVYYKKIRAFVDTHFPQA